MRLTLLSLFLLFTYFAGAQNLSFDKNLIEKSISPGEVDVPAYSRIINSSSEDLIVVWIREVNDLPRGWQSAVCDTNQCYLPQVDSARFNIAANSDAPIIPHIYPDGSSGSAQMTVRVVNVDDRADNAVATFSFPMVSSTTSAFKASARLFPNPASESFKIESTEQLGGVTITNMLGKVVHKFHRSQESYQVSDLPNGIYLVSIFDTSGRIVKTLRFTKRNMMP